MMKKKLFNLLMLSTFLFAGVHGNILIKSNTNTNYVLALDFDGVLVETVKWYSMAPKWFSMQFTWNALAKEKKRNEVYHVRTPIFAMWRFVKSFYNAYKMPIFLWTNNSLNQLQGKLLHCEKEHNLTLKFDGIVTKDLLGVEKPHPEYYLQAYNLTMKHLEDSNIDIQNTEIIFVDDSINNVQAANKVAKDYNLSLKAVHFPTAQQGIAELQALLT